MKATVVSLWGASFRPWRRGKVIPKGKCEIGSASVALAIVT